MNKCILYNLCTVYSITVILLLFIIIHKSVYLLNRRNNVWPGVLRTGVYIILTFIYKIIY